MSFRFNLGQKKQLCQCQLLFSHRKIIITSVIGLWNILIKLGCGVTNFIILCEKVNTFSTDHKIVIQCVYGQKVCIVTCSLYCDKSYMSPHRMNVASPHVVTCSLYCDKSYVTTRDERCIPACCMDVIKASCLVLFRSIIIIFTLYILLISTPIPMDTFAFSFISFFFFGHKWFFHHM